MYASIASLYVDCVAKVVCCSFISLRFMHMDDPCAPSRWRVLLLLMFSPCVCVSLYYGPEAAADKPTNTHTHTDVCRETFNTCTRITCTRIL